MKTNRRGFARALTGSGLALSSAFGASASAAPSKGSRIGKIEVIPVGIEFRTIFNIGVGKVGGKGEPAKYVFVKASTDDGRVGWGATTTVPNWSYETAEAVVGPSITI
jgi:hypothetical protein